MTLHPSLRALRATLMLTLGALPACVGSDDGKESADTDSSVPAAACVGSTPILDGAGAPTGFERCEDGTIHRATAEPTSATIDLPACNGDEANLYCTTDADCTGGPNGKCYHIDHVVMGGRVTAPDTGSTDDGCSCTYACAADADCEAGQACIPGGLAGDGLDHSFCQTAECVTDADCASGECGLSTYDDGCSHHTTLTCRDDADTCRTDADCDGATCSADDGEPAYACRNQDCDIGRPLLVEGRPRVASPTRREEWAFTLDLDLDELDEHLRGRLGVWWREIAALEHASVASFARFTLQLLALGAPPELLANTQAAAADEIGHARLCYGLASLYLGEPVGPGPLSLREVDVVTSPREVLVSLIEEAVVGETLGAAEARHAASQVEHAGLRAALDRLAEDEARHAALAWRALRWMVERDPSLAEVAVQTLEAVVEAVRRAPPVQTPDAAAHGVLGTDERRRVHLATLTQIIVPCCSFLKSKTVST